MRVRAAAGSLVAMTALVVVLVGPAAAAPEDCSYDAGTKAVTATVASGGQATLVVVGGALHFGATPAPCGAATTTNTDSITINGAAGSDEILTLDHRGGVFGPGFTSEVNVRESEGATALGDATDRVIVYATEGNDFMAAGQNGLALNTDGDLDVSFVPNTFKLEMHMLGGDDFYNGRGQGGAGLKFLGPMVVTGGEGNESLLRGGGAADIIDGGPGNDNIESQEGADIVDGGPGDDIIAGGDHNDILTGGPGADSFSASGGDDIIYAEDDEADTLINGGSEVDTAYFDENLDPNPVAVENKIGDGGPPPPPPAGCVFDAGAKAVSATIDSGTSATLEVVGGAIWFDGAVCGAATTTNTDSITIGGVAGTIETFEIDLAGGAFAPGVAVESSGLSEIEISANLGDATDVVVVRGGSAADVLRMGQNGLGLNADSDRDVTFSVLPAQVEMFGNGGVNTLSGKGGSGTGSTFAGKVILHAGDSGDLLQGGNSADELYGGAGNDRLEGGSGDDTMVGGLGSDQFVGSGGNDTMRADDDLADSLISGGAGTDTAYYDVGVDPNPTATENKIPA
jgi:Ca2+-binding RTX toxin-like protein